MTAFPLRLPILPLLLALVFFAASLTPTLIPRGWLVQGALGGIVAALGYALGRFALWLWTVLSLPKASGRSALIAHLTLALPTLVVAFLCLSNAHEWQNGIRARMGMEMLDTAHPVRVLLLAMLVFALLALAGFSAQWAFDRTRVWLDRFMPRRTANVAGFLLVALALVVVTRDGVLDRAVNALDRSYTIAQGLFDTAPPPPTTVGMSGGQGSLVSWAAMGQPGRTFVTGGPDADAIAAFTGREALKPIRVYVGLAEADTAADRAAVALAELERLGGFERDVLVVAMPTGTGWMDPGSFDPLEYMHGGDVATVAVQYSYLQSPLALILETDAGLVQARALIGAVHRYWKELPEADRPRLYVHGLSLGAWSSMYGTDLFAYLDDPIDGAFWAGPPFPSATWNRIVAERDPGSPYILPTLRDGRLVRFASNVRGAGGPDGWGDMRIAFLQYASDAIVFYEPASAWRAPAWMREPTAPDVSDELRFMPLVTQFQLAVDMALATTAPAGFGHSYWAPDYIGPWVAVTAPRNWTPDDMKRLIAHCDRGFQLGCRNG